MNTFHKIVSTLLLFPVAFVLFTLGIVFLMEGYNILNPYVDTEFGENYTPQKFDRINVNHSKKYVISTIGIPLHEYKKLHGKDSITIYSYTNDGYFRRSNKKHTSCLIEDYAWYRSNVMFNKDDKVIAIDKGWSHD